MVKELENSGEEVDEINLALRISSGVIRTFSHLLYEIYQILKKDTRAEKDVEPKKKKKRFFGLF